MTAIKFNQACIIAFALLAFLIDLPWLVLVVGVVLAIGAAWPRAALFKVVYHRLFKPAGILQPRIIDDDPRPHRFAMGMAASFMLVASGFLLLWNLPVVGWLLAGLVALLAAINLLSGFCAGCFTYYQLGRLGLVRPSHPSS
jgi:hypothetical protein